MNFEDEINKLERITSNNIFIIKKGTIPILFSAPHSINQNLNNNSFKKIEPYTKAISLYLNKYFNTFSFIKAKDTGEDSNRDNNDEYKKQLINLVKENNIKLVIDLHGASQNRNFDIEFGTLNNLSASFSTINELKETFTENGIKNIALNSPFKGGAITQYLHGLKNVDVIQLEINKKYRDAKNIELLEQLINCLAKFIKQYISY